MSILFLKVFQNILIFSTQWCIIRTSTRMVVIIMDVGTKIKQARLAKGMTQEELGEILGLQKSAVAKYENGRVVNIKRSTLKKISDALDIPPFELVFDDRGKPTADDELSENVRQLVEFAKAVPEDKVELVLKLMRTIVEDD